MKFEAFILARLAARNRKYISGITSIILVILPLFIRNLEVEAFWNPFSFYKPAWSQAAQPTYDYFHPRPIYQDQIYEAPGMAIYEVKVPEESCNDKVSRCPSFAHLCYHKLYYSIKELCPRTCGFSCDQVRNSNCQTCSKMLPFSKWLQAGRIYSDTIGNQQWKLLQRIRA